MERERHYSTAHDRARRTKWYWRAVVGFVGVLVLSDFVISFIPKLPPPNPRWMEFQQLAVSAVDAVHAFQAHHDGRSPEDNTDLMNFMTSANPSWTMPHDQWGRPLIYFLSAGRCNVPHVVSFGADGEEGGSGDDEDFFVDAPPWKR